MTAEQVRKCKGLDGALDGLDEALRGFDGALGSLDKALEGLDGALGAWIGH